MVAVWRERVSKKQGIFANFGVEIGQKGLISWATSVPYRPILSEIIREFCEEISDL